MAQREAIALAAVRQLFGTAGAERFTAHLRGARVAASRARRKHKTEQTSLPV